MSKKAINNAKNGSKSNTKAKPNAKPNAKKDTKPVKKQDDDAPKKGELLLKNVRKSFWVGVSILAILLIISIIVLSVIISDYARADERSVLLKSNMSENLDIFSLYYTNDTGEITISGSNGDKVIAPGATVEYSIRIKNDDRMALDYEFAPVVKLVGEYKLPILVRILDPDQNYVLGSAKEWVPIDEINKVAYRDTLTRGEAVEYTFQWKWPFESGNDEYDTFLGGLDVDTGLSLSFNIHAAANTGMDANGGFLQSGMAKTIGLLVVAIMLLVALILIVIAVLKRIAKVTEPITIIKEIFVNVPAPAPVLPKKEGFTGKMTYINIDMFADKFHSGEVVTLTKLKKLGLIPENTKQMKVLARNGYKLDKAFILETQGISGNARKVIAEAGGKVIITKG